MCCFFFLPLPSEHVSASLDRLESEQRLHSSALALHALYPSLKRLATAAHPYLVAQMQAVDAGAALAAAQKALSELAGAATGAGKKANKKAASAAAGSTAGAPAASAFSNDDVVKPVLGAVDWASAGLVRYPPLVCLSLACLSN
jgi:protein involved in temperature-dependent protein secretion